MKICSKCKKEKPDEEFNFRIRSKEIRQYQCKDCTRTLIRNHYYKNKDYYLQKTRHRNGELRLKIQNHLKGYLLGHPCVDCGETDLTVLEFDHKGDIKKLMAVSQLMRMQYSIEKISEEIEKCDVRCANCHRRKTAKQFKWYKIMMPL